VRPREKRMADALDTLAHIVKNLRGGTGPRTVAVEMDRETFVDFALGQITKAAREPKEKAVARLELLQKNRDRLAKEFSFEGNIDVPVTVETFEDEFQQKPTSEDAALITRQPAGGLFAENPGDLFGPPPKAGPVGGGEMPPIEQQPAGGSTFAASDGKDGSYAVGKRDEASDDDDGAWPEDLNDLGGKGNTVDWGRDPEALRA